MSLFSAPGGFVHVNVGRLLNVTQSMFGSAFGLKDVTTGAAATMNVYGTLNAVLT